MKAVLDTNVLASALAFPGGPTEEALEMTTDGRLQLVTSRPLLAELGRALTDGLGWAPAIAEEAVVRIIRIAAVVEPAERIALVSADPTDDRVLEAAVEGAVDVVVTGDRHLLRLGTWREIRIVDPATFVAEPGY